MNPRLSMNTMTTKDWDLGQCVDAYAKLGFRGIGITRVGIEAYGAKKGVKKINDSGMHVVSMGSIGPLLPTAHLSPYASSQGHEAGIELAAELKSDCLYVVSGPRGKHTWEEAAKRLNEELAKVVPIARRYGVRLALEPVHPMRQDLTFVNTARDSFDIIAPFDANVLGYVFDFYHCWWERGVMETVARSAARMAAVQISNHKAKTMKTMDRGMINDGIIPVRDMLRATERAGYKGFYDIEIISDDMASIGYDKVLPRIIKEFDDLWASAFA